MRLTFVTAWPLDTAGGIQTLVRRLAGALARAPGVEVTVITGHMPDEPTIELGEPLPPGPRLSFQAGAPPAWIPPPGELVGQACLEGLERAVAGARPDALISVGHHSAEAHQAARVAAELEIPLVLWPLVHTDAPRHVNRTATALYRRATLVVCCSGAERRWLTERAGIPAARMLLLECGSWAADAARPRGDPRRPGEPLELFTVGAFSRHKRLEDQVEAVARLRSAGLRAHLTMAGVARGRGVLDRLTALVRDRDLGDLVSLAPDAAETTLAGLYASADYFLFTSASESFGLALLDAICAGAFPIVYPHPTYVDLVEASGFGRVASSSTPAALTDAIRRAVEDGEPRSDPPAAWRAGHAWSRVARSLLARLDGLRA